MRLLIASLIFARAACFAATYPMPTPEVQYVDASGVPLAGAKLCTYVANTSTPQATYTDSTGGTPNTNPVILDSAGRASIWLNPVLYKFVLLVGGDSTCATGAVQWTQDNVGATFSVGGSAGYVQYSKAGGLFGGDNKFSWNSVQQALTIVALSGSAAGITVGTGYVLAEAGFLASNIASPTTPLAYNVIQAPYGGMAAKSFTAVNYIQAGNSAGVPTLTPSDAFHAGALYWDTVGTCLKVYNGATWACVSAGITSVNTLTGALTLAGTANQVVLTPVGNTITFSTPQSIATGSSPTFANVTVAGAFNSTATGASIALQVNSGTFQVDGDGNLSMAQVLTSAGGVNVTTVTNNDSIQTSGGITATTGFWLGVAAVIDNTGVFVSAAGVDVPATVSGTGFSIHGGATGVTGGTCSSFVGGICVAL